MKIKVVIFCVIIPLLFAACSSSQKATENTDRDTTKIEKKDSLYVFDAVPAAEKIDTVKENSFAGAERMKMTFYVVQIGAFNTKDAADEFAANSRKKINYGINVSYNPDIKLYVVQITKDYTSHDEAERVRNELWQIGDFKDAWITTIQK